VPPSETNEEYVKAIVEDIEDELVAFETHILPLFIVRGYSKAAALAYYSNRQIVDNLSELLDRVDTGNSGNEGRDEPWKS
jgi:hypothetical protein